jgi:hypothetical protein
MAAERFGRFLDFFKKGLHPVDFSIAEFILAGRIALLALLKM